MPSRWWLPLPDARPDRVRLEHLHAALSHWLDPSEQAHVARTKPWAISPLASEDGETGCEVALLERAASAPPATVESPVPDLVSRLRRQAKPGVTIRLGADRVQVGEPRLIASETWESLAAPRSTRSWELDFVTPVTFRSGNRSSPLPAPRTLLRGLLESWNTCSGLPERMLDRRHDDAVWVSDLSGRSVTMKLSGLTVSGFLGQVTYRCDERAAAELADGLFRLAPYTGCGSARAKGLGVTRLTLPGRRGTR